MENKKKAFRELILKKFSGIPYVKNSLILADCLVRGKPLDIKDNELPAEFIHYLLTDTEASEYITHKGLTVQNAKISGMLDLEGLSFDHFLSFENCTFKEGIELDRARIRTLSLSGSTVKGWVKMVGADVKGQLDFRGATFEKNIQCLVIQFSKVEGCVFFDKGFQANSEVNLQGTHIKGSLFCEGATFSNPHGRAIHAKKLNVDGDVLLIAEKATDDLRKAFKAIGEVKLCGARIGGQLKCRGGIFKKPVSIVDVDDYSNPQCALIARGLYVDGPVILDKGFHADGEVNLMNARIQGNLDCSGGFFNNEGQRALFAKGIMVDGDVMLCENEYSTKSKKIRFKANGEVKLCGATVKGRLQCSGGVFNNAVAYSEPGYALIAEGINVRDSVLLNDSFSANGIVNFFNARIDQTFLLENVIKNPGFKLFLTNAYAETMVVYESGWPVKEMLDIKDFTYENFIYHLPKTKKTQKVIEWLELNEPPFSPQPYRLLAKVLENKGREIEARDIRIEMNNQLRKESPDKKRRIWLSFTGWLIGYGYKPFKVWKIALVIWLLGALFYMFGNQLQVMQPYSKFAHQDYDRHVFELYEYHPKFCALVYSLDVFLPIVNLHQEESYRPATEPPLDYKENVLTDWLVDPVRRATGYFLIIWMYFQILSGWLLTTMLVGGLTGLIRAK